MIAAVAIAAAVVFARSSRLGILRLRRRTDVSPDAAPLLFLEMTALGVSGGLSFAQAAALAAAEVGGEVGSTVTRMLRGAPVGDERGLAGVFAAARRAVVTGAPLLPALDGHIAELRAGQRYARLERIRKLPVKLLFPLALLVLPGFLLLTVGPVVAGSLQRLGL